MHELKTSGKNLRYLDGESVLDCLKRHQIEVRSSCMSGICQSCLIQGSGQIPALAQKGVAPGLRKQGYFLACQCPASADLEVLSLAGRETYPSKILSVSVCGTNIIRIQLSRPANFAFEAGQFIELIRPEDQLSRSYSIASLPHEPFIELHVAVLASGKMSTYLEGAVGEEIQLRGPSGDCFYCEAYRDEPLLLAGTGTGAAPLWGIVRAALESQHSAPIHLFLGARHPSGLYLQDPLQVLSAQHSNLHVHFSVLSGDAEMERITALPLPKLIQETITDYAQQRVFLCGNPEIVKQLTKQCFLAGAAMHKIHSDPFVLAKS